MAIWNWWPPSIPLPRLDNRKYMRKFSTTTGRKLNMDIAPRDCSVICLFCDVLCFVDASDHVEK